MRFVSLWILAVIIVCCNGCNRKRNLSDIPILPNLTMDEYEEQVGSPSRIGNSNRWIAYNLKSGGELRLFFLNGPPGGRRTLSHAYIFNEAGNVVKHVFDMTPATRPATMPAAPPATSESARS